MIDFQPHLTEELVVDAEPTIGRPEELILALQTTPNACIELVNSFACAQLGLASVVSNDDGDLALARQDGAQFRMRFAGAAKFLVLRKPATRRQWIGGEGAQMSASDAVADLVNFANGVP